MRVLGLLVVTVGILGCATPPDEWKRPTQYRGRPRANEPPARTDSERDLALVPVAPLPPPLEEAAPAEVASSTVATPAPDEVTQMSRPGESREQTARRVCRERRRPVDEDRCWGTVMREDLWVFLRHGSDGADTLIGRFQKKHPFAPPEFARHVEPSSPKPDSTACEKVIAEPWAAACGALRLEEDWLAWSAGKRSQLRDVAREMVRGSRPADVVDADAWVLDGANGHMLSAGRFRAEIVSARAERTEGGVRLAVTHLIEHRVKGSMSIPDTLLYALDSRRVRRSANRLAAMMGRVVGGEHILASIPAGQRLERVEAIELGADDVGRPLTLALTDPSSGATAKVSVTWRAAPAPAPEAE